MKIRLDALMLPIVVTTSANRMGQRQQAASARSVHFAAEGER
jgi:hypothetical protein